VRDVAISLLAVTLLAATIAVGSSEGNSFAEIGDAPQGTWDGFKRSSVYVDSRDGIKLAIDIYLPTRNGALPTEGVPTLLRITPYNRTVLNTGTGELRHTWDLMQASSRRFLEHGYALVIADARGFGASFGVRDDLIGPVDGRDGHDIIKWLAQQPWSDGNVGMFGTSWDGMVQLFVAAERPPNLRAIYPSVFTSPDILDNLFIAKGGIFFKHLFGWAQRQDEQEDTAAQWAAPPVDADKDGKMLAAAKRSRESYARSTQDSEEGFGGALNDNVFRDSNFPAPGNAFYRELAPRLREARIPTYLSGAFFDSFPGGLWYAQLSTPKKLVIGPWAHDNFRGENDPRNLNSRHIEFREQLRWFEYWLKGVDSGVMAEAPVHYAIMDIEDAAWTWRSAPDWPDRRATSTAYYFAAEKASSVASQNDGSLLETKSSTEVAQAWRPNFDVGAAELGRGQNAGTVLPLFYPDQSANDAKGLTFTTAPLANDVVVAGIPRVDIYLTSTEPDADVFVYLQEIDTEGRSHYVTEGMLRASARKLSQPPYEFFGLPHPSLLRTDRATTPPLNTEVAHLAFTMLSTANRFDKGHRIRVTLQGTDKYTVLKPLDKPARLRVQMGGARASAISLPVLPTQGPK
jgi:uncharacterized protein